MIYKIYKISFILLFMLFVTGLFNFCFAAVTVDSFNFVDMDVPECTSENFDFLSITDGLDRQNLINAATTYINKFLDGTYDSYIYFKSSDCWYLTFLHPSITDTSGEIAKMYSNGTAVHFKPYGCLPIKYNTDKEKWELQLYDSYINTSPYLYGINKFSTNGITVAKSSNFICYTDDTFSDILVDSSEFNKPSNEELIAGCDFKVNFKFAPESADFPNDNVGSRWSWPCRLLVEHSMTNWADNYNVKVKMSAIDKTQLNGLYYDLYDSNGEEIQKKKHIKEEILTENLNVGDFFLFFTDNLQDTFKFEYEIYNKSDELLLKKIYTFKFTKSGLTAFNSTGTIMSENIQDSTGQDIENGGNSFDTNGYDNTITDNSYYDVSNLDNLASSASETINLAKKCFEILPGFIWVMVGVFLSVCIALRILGR